MTLKIKRFADLTADEVYDILALRCQIFVVEQHCFYPDPDGIDKRAWHFWLEDEDGSIKAYLRMFPLEYGTVSIGRVLAVEQRHGAGSELMQAAIRFAFNELKVTAIELDSQTHAVEFYRKLGFKEISEEFEEAGIPHIKMRLTID